MADTLTDLRNRGLVQAISDEALGRLLQQETVPFYAGYDPSAPSLQLGNLCAIIMMRRLQLAGHRPVVLMGGATGMIGDPSGRSQERNLLDENALARNLSAQQAQLEKLLDFGDGPADAVLVNNHDWLGAFSFLGFLREVGKRFRVGEMLAKESVKARMASAEGISFTEFSYQILQAYDFLHLYKSHGVQLQIGGGDQWGNITAGIDLIRKVEGAQAFGLVIPLVTDAQGKKFGKSQTGAIYLDPDMTSPYLMYQYLLNSDDQSVIRYLRYFTFLTLPEIADLEQKSRAAPEAREAQRMLARTVVEMVHGPAGRRTAEQATEVFFGGPIKDLSDQDLAAIFQDLPTVTLPRRDLETGVNVIDLLSSTPLFKSKGEARRAVQQKGAYVNNHPVESIERSLSTHDLATPTALVIRKGKKNYCVVRVE